MKRSPPAKTTEKTAPKDVGAVVNAIRILRHLAKFNGPDGVVHIARATGIGASTTFNILRTLVRERMLSFNPVDKSYSLGLGLSELFSGLVGMSPSQLLQPELDRIAERTRATVVIWRATETELIVVGKAAITSTIRIDVDLGLRVPRFNGASGRVIAAGDVRSDHELAAIYETLAWEEKPSLKAYIADIRRTAKRGWGVDKGESYVGVTSISAPITNSDGIPQFSIAVLMLSDRAQAADLEQIGEDLRTTCLQISGSLYPRHLSLT